MPSHMQNAKRKTITASGNCRMSISDLPHRSRPRNRSGQHPNAVRMAPSGRVYGMSAQTCLQCPQGSTCDVCKWIPLLLCLSLLLGGGILNQGTLILKCAGCASSAPWLQLQLQEKRMKGDSASIRSAKLGLIRRTKKSH